MASVLQEIQSLRKLIREHSHHYYVENNPRISDEEFDSLYDRLLQLEAENPGLITPDSPTQRVGADTQEGFENYEHRVPMLSLSKTTSYDGFIDFNERINKILTKDNDDSQEFSFVCEPKLDGLALEVIYENGHLIKAATRGNGLVGEDVTRNVRTIKSIPLVLQSNDIEIPELIEIRGEVIFKKADFVKMNEARRNAGDDVFANPRNSASGSLRQLDPSISAQRPLSAFFYDIGTLRGANVTTHIEQLKLIQALGLPIVEHSKALKSVEEVKEYFDNITKNRPELPMEIDGVVVKVNNLFQHQILGQISRSPRWAIAWKFPSLSAMTKLLDVLWNVGRTGAVTPVGILEPVEIGGVIVKRVSLHNEALIEEKDIRIGDSVMVKRAGDVIPYVESSVKDMRDGSEIKIVLPEHCPSCGTELYLAPDDAFHRCPNKASCPAQIKESIIHFVSKGAMDIDGLGEKQIKLFLEKGLIKTTADLYHIKAEQLIPLERMGEKSAQNIITAIKNSKTQSLWRFINALGIPTVGSHLAQVLADNFTSIDEIMSKTVEELTEIKEIGPIIAENIISYFNAEENKRLILDFKEIGIDPKSLINRISKSDLPLYEKTFVFTGTLGKMTRSQAKEQLQKLGAKVSSSVSKKTDYIVAGENPGSKLEKGKKLKIPIIDEEELREILSNNTPQSPETPSLFDL